MTQKDQLKEALWRSLLQMSGDDLKLDRTLKGVIKKVYGSNEYEVQAEAQVFKAKSSLDIAFSVNEEVWVTVPQGRYSDLFISGRRR